MSTDVDVMAARAGTGDAGDGGSLFAGVAPEVWDDLAGPHFYSSAAWLRFCARKGGGTAGAAVASAQGRPAAAVPVLALTQPPPPLYRWNDLLAARNLPPLPEGGLLVGPRQGYQTHLLGAAGPDRPAHAARLLDVLRHWPDDAAGEPGPRARVALYVPTADALTLRDAGVDAEPVLLEADAWFELPPGGWDGWLDSLPPKRRGNVRREARQFRDAGYTVEHLGLADCYERLAPLAACTQSKYGDTAPTEFWLALLRGHAEGMGAAARVAVCRRDGEIVGFCLYYVFGGTLFLRWAGFDYARLDGSAEYFNLVYYSNVRLAPELGVRRIHAGIKAPQAKALRGAQLRPLWLVHLDRDSPLTRHRDEVRRHNRRAYERLLTEAATATAMADRESWLVFS